MNRLYPSPQQPAYIKLVNRLGERLERAGVTKPEISADRLISHAKKRMKLSDFGDLSFRLGLEKLCSGLNEQARLSQIGRIAAYFNMLDYLCVRLEMVDYQKKRPEVSKQQIKRPLIILGLPRTGTTILYELLAQDPSHRSPASWEVAKPFPPARAESYDIDIRIKSVDRQLAAAETLSPGFKSIHAIGARLPQECVYILASHFISEQYGFMYHIPDYRAWALEQDMTESYRWHAQFLKHLQIDFQRERWVLKTPPHLAYLKYLLAEYPDSALVWTHRPPLKAITSFASLAATLHSGFSDVIDPHDIGKHEATHFAKMLNQGLEQRQRLDVGQFFDLSFSDICTDPIAAVHSIYDYFGFDFSAEAERRMRQYIEHHPRGLYGKHKYTAGDFGLSDQQYSALFAEYEAHFQRYLV